MKVCFVCSHLWPHSYGGAERRYYILAKELMKRGHDVVYVTYDYGESEIPLATVGPPPRLYDEKGRRRLLPALEFGWKTAKLVEKLKCDVVDVTVPYTTALFMKPRSFVLTYHEYWGKYWEHYFSKPLGTLAAIAEKRLLRKAVLVITPSKLVANRILSEVGTVKVAPVPIGLNPDDYAKYRGRSRDIDVTMIGRFTYTKGWWRLIEVLRQVDKPLRVAVVGDGPLYNEVTAQLEKLHHEVHSYRKASEEEKLELLARSKYYLNLSDAEGFSIATLEAILCGATPIVLDTGLNAAVEIVEETGCGYIAKNLREIAEQVAKETSTCTPNISGYTIQTFVNNYLRFLGELQTMRVNA
ncbi:glycosyltransferase family 4 protein [Thermofilum pendens]|uniref:Glycosyl transferase, group 1 n=1 Tax=Thermofilum pendens (strain DSM 2475 / Hrk 5) TaxID=368408 RepID=A1S0Z0_THEPD|nr:glycosyltransferase family 4 protein [Thermofilum pendens]ABL79120.1 glycosyl transferase, group 1 [Thermofilum pendens Hrk 5]